MKYIYTITVLLVLLSSCQENKKPKAEEKCKSGNTHCQQKGTLENDVILHINEQKTSSRENQGQSISPCEKGYIQISSFCVMKEEGRKDIGAKFQSSTPEEAQAFCKDLGKRLINHKEWMEIARKISEQGTNFDHHKKLIPAKELFVDEKTTIIDFMGSQPEWVAWSEKSLYLPSHCQPHVGKSYLSSCENLSFGDPEIDGLIYKGEVKDKHKISLVRSGSLPKHKKKLYNLYLGNPPSKRAYGVRCVHSL